MHLCSSNYLHSCPLGIFFMLYPIIFAKVATLERDFISGQSSHVLFSLGVLLRALIVLSYEHPYWCECAWSYRVCDDAVLIWEIVKCFRNYRNLRLLQSATLTQWIGKQLWLHVHPEPERFAIVLKNSSNSHWFLERQQGEEMGFEHRIGLRTAFLANCPSQAILVQPSII